MSKALSIEMSKALSIEMIPFFSVVVPTYNRPLLLQRCLEALTAQTLDKKLFEVIVVDDGNDEKTLAIVDRYIRTTNLRLHYIPMSKHSGPAAARNKGVKSAKGRIIAFTDDDTIPDKEWLKSAQKSFQKGILVATGKVSVPVSNPMTDYELNTKHLETAEFLTANLFIAKNLFQQVGGFDERFTMAYREDSDFQFNLISNQIKVQKIPEALVIHPVRSAPFGISIKEQKKSLFNALLYKKYPRLYRQKVQSSPPRNYYLITSFLVLFIIFILVGMFYLTIIAFVGWLFLTLKFVHKRLVNTSHSLEHISEIFFTSMVIPPLSIFWRLYGAIKFKVFFL